MMHAKVREKIAGVAISRFPLTAQQLRVNARKAHFLYLFNEFYKRLSIKCKLKSAESVTFAYQMKAVRAILAVFFALMVLVSSTSFMIGMHVCMDQVQNIALFSKADSCEKEQSLPACHREKKALCCEEQTIIHETSDLKASAAADHHAVVPAPTDLEQPLVLISEVIPSAAPDPYKYYRYDPPARSCDLTVEHQVFLI